MAAVGGMLMHHSQRILTGLGYPAIPISADHFLSSAVIVLAMLSLPAMATYLTHEIARCLDPRQRTYLAAIYAYLPFTLALNLAHYLPAVMTEAEQILPVSARVLGFSGTGLPTFTWSTDVAAFMQERGTSRQEDSQSL